MSFLLPGLLVAAAVLFHVLELQASGVALCFPELLHLIADSTVDPVQPYKPYILVAYRPVSPDSGETPTVA